MTYIKGGVMKKQISGSIEYKEVEYDYTAVIYTGDEAHTYPDQITDLDRADGEPLNDEVWEAIEMIALANAQLVEWCEKEGWREEHIGTGHYMLSRTEKGITTRIVGAREPVLPQSMGEPVVVSKYNSADELLGKSQIFKGGINEWIADPSVSRWSPYADTIKKFAAQLGRGDVNPRWVEAFMLLEYSSLNSISPESFKREVSTAINCIDFLGPKKAEQCAQSFGL